MNAQLEFYYNTTSIEGEQLKQRRIRAGSQNDAILSYFKRNPGYIYSPDEIHKVMNLPLVPITSIRRAMSDLSNPKLFNGNPPLEKTNVKKLGSYGAEVYCWRLK
jgi:hypothetical protein